MLKLNCLARRVKFPLNVRLSFLLGIVAVILVVHGSAQAENRSKNVKEVLSQTETLSRYIARHRKYSLHLCRTYPDGKYRPDKIEKRVEKYDRTYSRSLTELRVKTRGLVRRLERMRENGRHFPKLNRFLRRLRAARRQQVSLRRDLESVKEQLAEGCPVDSQGSV
ncbi:MAG: hypothetical protein DCC75_01020 [Proteobacteria bacterium]|nr:MAG: hypothetical protein DCC75_01020 [Pseudomonadota bacterium]